jgi:protein SCO1/2
LNILKKIIILALILILPGFLYYQLTVKGKNAYHALSIFGPKKVANTFHTVKGKQIPDTVYHTLPAFNLVDKNGKPVLLSTFDNKIFVVNFFYTHCPNICGVMNKNMDSLAWKYAKMNIDFVSITVDPQRDDAAALKTYSKGFSGLADRMFLTGDTATIYNLARNGFLVNALKVTNDDFIYSDKIMLIDVDKRIRGYYTGTLPDEFDRLDNEINVLLREKINKNSTPVY